MLIRSTAIRASNIAKRIFLNRLSPALRSRDNQRYWEEIKGRHSGRRGFVVCNGPSLRMGDLDRLVDEITIASNKIYLAFPETRWRPTYFTICDELVAKKIANEVHRHAEIVHAPVNIGVEFPGCTTRYWKALRAAKQLPSKKSLFSPDASRGFYGGYSVTFYNLQLAVHLGLDPIYIIGCDHSYKGEDDPRKVGMIQVGRSNNHFIKGYREKGEVVNAAPVDKMTIAFYHALAFSEREGVCIRNATRGGNLEVFGRVDFDQVIPPSGSVRMSG